MFVNPFLTSFLTSLKNAPMLNTGPSECWQRTERDAFASPLGTSVLFGVPETLTERIWKGSTGICHRLRADKRHVGWWAKGNPVKR
jgi:hypothetical protein